MDTCVLHRKNMMKNFKHNMVSPILFYMIYLYGKRLDIDPVAAAGSADRCG